jgi:hypothetical protein
MLNAQHVTVSIANNPSFITRPSLYLQFLLAPAGLLRMTGKVDLPDQAADKTTAIGSSGQNFAFAILPGGLSLLRAGMIA